MRCYIVGGAVRDMIMGLDPVDRDWVVVGGSVEEMLSLGFLPVGKDFPVFLHPETKEEYALARTERKSGRGYKGFTVCASPSVTLEEDLSRRDLTINAIALDDTGTIIDPFGGVADIQKKVLRHVSPAFIEDPLRVLRLARFAARYPAFSVCEDTLVLCCAIVSQGEILSLTPERVWQELVSGLAACLPSRMFRFLFSCGAFFELFPELSQKNDTVSLRSFFGADGFLTGLRVEERCAYYFAEFLDDRGLIKMAHRLRMPRSYKQMSVVWQRFLSRPSIRSPKDLVCLFDHLDLWRNPHLIDSLVRLSTVRFSDSCQSLKEAFLVAKKVRLEPEECAGWPGDAVGRRMQEKRVAAVTCFFSDDAYPCKTEYPGKEM